MIEDVLARARGRRSRALVTGLCLATSACSTTPEVNPPLSQQRELESLKEVAAYPGSDQVVVLATMQQFMASHREWEGYEYFDRLAREQPERRALFRSLQGVMQARVAEEIGLFRRVAWVEDSIAKLDAGAAADPVLGRFARGLVCAELPERFGKAHQAVEDLESCLEHRDDLPVDLDRGIYRGLAKAYDTLGEERRSSEMLARAGLDSLDDARSPRILGSLSVSAEDRFRFSKKRFIREADDVFVAEGYDFANIAFIIRDSFVVAIDAGTTERTARVAVEQLRKVTRAPIKYVILTHGHWDHVGGLAAVREPGSVVIAQESFAKELERSRRTNPPYKYFFGSDPIPLDVKPDRLVAAPETLRDGDLELTLIPLRGGETEDALLVEYKKRGLLFVGDVFMPYVGAPFVAEGSPEDYVRAMDAVTSLAPRRLIHGHPPLTALFTIEAMPGLRVAVGELLERTVAAARAARPVADMFHDAFIPESLKSSPKAALPYLVIRDNFVQRVYAQQAGYWRANREGMEVFTTPEWAAALDLIGGGGDAPFARAADDLLSRGDAGLALSVAEGGLIRYPSSDALARSRERALAMLRERYATTSPFRFIIYSETAGRDLRPVRIAEGSERRGPEK
jgi:glyoxylase-like metal-dependent hydrolase (beta-lactamase superfamily II)